MTPFKPKILAFATSNYDDMFNNDFFVGCNENTTMSTNYKFHVFHMHSLFHGRAKLIVLIKLFLLWLKMMLYNLFLHN